MEFCVITNKRKYVCNKGIDACLFLEYDLHAYEHLKSVRVDSEEHSGVCDTSGRVRVKDAQMFINRKARGLSGETQDPSTELMNFVKNTATSCILPSTFQGKSVHDFVDIAVVHDQLYLNLYGLSTKEEEVFVFSIKRGIKLFGLSLVAEPQYFDCRYTIGYVGLRGLSVPVNIYNPKLNYERLHYFGGQYPTSADHRLAEVTMDEITKKPLYEIGDDVLFGNDRKWESGIITHIVGLTFSVDGRVYYPQDSILCLYEGAIPNLDFLIGAETLCPIKDSTC